MEERKRILLWSILIMAGISIVVLAVVIPILYEAAFAGQSRRLSEIAQSHARLLEAIAATVPGPEAALPIVRQAHENFAGFGATGEFSLARRNDGQIEFLLHRRHAVLANPAAVAFAAMQDRPIGRALSGFSGTMVGVDYRGEQVLAAYEPVAHLHWGIVAKIDLSEIRLPFIKAAIVAASVAATLILCGVVLFLRLSAPLMRRLEESEASTQAILNTAPDGIIIFGANGTIHSLNHAAERLFGCAAPEVIGQDVSRLMPSLYLEKFDDSLRSDAGHGVRTMLGPVHETTGHRRDGRTFPVDIAMSAVRVSDRRLFTCIVRDITQRKRLEGQLRQLQKMEAVGTLVGGIAHDFNNILAAILGYTELALSKITRRSLSRRYLQEVLIAAKRAKDLVQQILAFSRRTEAERQPVRLVPLVREALSLLRASLPSTIEIRQHLDKEAGMVLADPTQIHQILMNLGVNAEYAMRGTGGILEVKLEAVALDSDTAALYPSLSPGAYVRLTVRDTGHGIPPDIMERIFEPFFTTKGIGEGTGMGLAVVHGIVTSHAGAIMVDSTPDRGTTFTIYLPRLFEAVGDDVASPESVPAGSGCILLIDDEEGLVRLGREILTLLGYNVVAYTSSREALEAFRATPERYDLVITDQTMPQMTGEALVRELRCISPDVPIILCTGFSHSVDADKARALGIDAFLAKPVEVREWAVTIQRVLDQHRA